MQKPNLPLIIFCFVALSFAGKAQSMYSPVEPNAQLKKGDWFNIEFANRLEDYCTPVDSINYCDPENLLQLVLHCEVTDVSKKKVNLKITLERLFHITDSGEYYDSYFDMQADYYRSVLEAESYIQNQNFEFEIEIKLANDEIEIEKNSFQEMPYYVYSVKEIVIGNNTDLGTPQNVESRYRGQSIYFSEMERMLLIYFRDWSNNEYKLPLPTFGDLQVTHFRKYRIVDANLPVQQNTEMVIEVVESMENDSVEVIFEDEFESFTTPIIAHTLKGYLKDGKITFQYYLEKQRELTLKYHGKEMNFIATPGKALNLKFHLNYGEFEADFIGDNLGDNLCEDQLAPSSLVTPRLSQYERNSYVAFHDTLEQLAKSLIWNLDQYKNQMTVNRYKKKLKMIYYWAASHSAEWHLKNLKTINYTAFENNKFAFTKLNELSYYKNIYPLYDYYLEPAFYKEYLDAFDPAKNNYQKGLLVSDIQGFQRKAYPFIDMHPIVNILFQGYPKYYYLADGLILSDGRIGNVSIPKMNQYNHFMANCKYPPFLEQVQNAYDLTVGSIQGSSILDLDLNFVKDKNYNRNNGKYKLIGFIDWSIDQKVIDDLKDSIASAENELNLENKFELYLIHTGTQTNFESIKLIEKIADIPIIPIELSKEDFKYDIRKLGFLNFLFLENRNITVISYDNKIVSLRSSINEFPRYTGYYVNNPKFHQSKKDYGQLIIIILSSLLFFGFLSWSVIRLRTVQIQKRETARRKVSELELTAIRSQMNPHFIFNAMGSIQNLINQNKVKNANLYLASFARLMRMVLANSNKKLVSMAHELELIETYLQLEQLRVDFKYQISVAENIDPEVEELPGMLIQPFIENAVIHGITPKGTGNIEVAFSKKVNTLICEITDDGVGIDTNKTQNGNGVAMKLSEKRLDLLNSQLQDKLKLVVENRMKTEQISGTKITLYIPVG